MKGDSVVPTTDHLRLTKRDLAKIDARDRDAVRALCAASMTRPDQAAWLNEQIELLGLRATAIAMRDEGRAAALRRRIRPVVNGRKSSGTKGRS